MPLSPAQRYSLAAASAVEAYAGSSLVLAPQRFIRRTYGVRGPLDPLTVKFARSAGIALSCLGLLAGLCVARDEAPPPVVATLALYNAGAALNNAGQSGGAAATAVHAGLALALLASSRR